MPAKRYAALLALCAGYSVLVTTASAWDYELAGAANANEWARAVVSDASGDVLAAGFTIGPSADAFTVVKLSGENGTEVWRRDINDNGGFSNEAAAVAVDGVGDVVAVGMLGHGGLTAIKFSGASGSELWRSSIHGTGSSAGAAFAVSLDSAGDVVVGGEIFNTGASGDWAIAKLSGTTGVEAWRHVVNGSANGLDYVYAVGVDSAGDVVASGSTNNLGTGQDFTVVKVAGTTARAPLRAPTRPPALLLT